MPYAVFQIGLGADAKAQRLVERLQASLCADTNTVLGPPAEVEANAALDQFATEASASGAGSHDDTPDTARLGIGHARRKAALIRQQLAPFAAQPVPGPLVVAIRVQVGAGLLDDENFAAQLQDVVHIRRRQGVEGLAVPALSRSLHGLPQGSLRER